jgi:hypothetical protein
MFKYHPNQPGTVRILADPPYEFTRELLWGYSVPHDPELNSYQLVAKAVEAMPLEQVREFLIAMKQHKADPKPHDLMDVDPAKIAHWLPILDELGITVDYPHPLGTLRFELEIVNGPEYLALREAYEALKSSFPIGMAEICRSPFSFRTLGAMVGDMASDNPDKAHSALRLCHELAQMSPKEIASVGASLLARGVQQEAVLGFVRSFYPTETIDLVKRMAEKRTLQGALRGRERVSRKAA